MMLGLNIGSGERRFTTIPNVIRWINVDKVSRAGHEPDLVCDGAHIARADSSADYFVLHQVLEHEGLGDGDGLIREAWRVLKPGGSLLIFIPDIRALAVRWLEGGIDDYIYVVNLMGAYYGEQSDRHRWHYTHRSLAKLLTDCAPWKVIKPFDWRTVPGMYPARDWWVLDCEAVK